MPATWTAPRQADRAIDALANKPNAQSALLGNKPNAQSACHQARRMRNRNGSYVHERAIDAYASGPNAHFTPAEMRNGWRAHSGHQNTFGIGLRAAIKIKHSFPQP
jgi:hypothetical protein